MAMSFQQAQTLLSEYRCELYWGFVLQNDRVDALKTIKSYQAIPQEFKNKITDELKMIKERDDANSRELIYAGRNANKNHFVRYSLKTNIWYDELLRNLTAEQDTPTEGLYLVLWAGGWTRIGDKHLTEVRGIMYGDQNVEEGYYSPSFAPSNDAESMGEQKFEEKVKSLRGCGGAIWMKVTRYRWPN